MQSIMLFFLMPILSWAKRRMIKFYKKTEQVYVPTQSMIRRIGKEGIIADMRIEN